MLKKVKIIMLLFIIGGSIYALLEIMVRKRTHISMFIAGGLCLVFIHCLCNVINPFCKMCRAFKAVLCSFVITIVEFITGIFVNLIMGLQVWDYSGLSFNILGQICPQFTLIWFILSFPAIFLVEIINKIVYQNRKLKI